MTYMLLKKEKSLKSKSEQLDLVKTIDQAAKQKKNQRIVTLILIVTFILSLSLWIYRQVKTVVILSPFNSRPSPAITSFSPNIHPEILNQQIKDLLPPDSSRWSFYVELFSVSGSSLANWSQNQSSIFTPSNDLAAIENNLKSIPPQSTSISFVLPQGLIIHEQVISVEKSYQAFYLINTPQENLLILFKVTDYPSLDKIKALIPTLAQTIYWSFISG